MLRLVTMRHHFLRKKAMDAVSVIILAAGEGTRMHSSKPKVLHEVCGYSMLAHVLNEALKTSDDICVVLGHKFDEVSAHLNENFSYEMRKKVHLARQNIQSHPGTGGAVMAAINSVKNDRVVILCADMPLIKARHLHIIADTGADVNIAVFKTNNPNGYGRVVLGPDSSVIDIVEQKDADEMQKGIKLCNSGVYSFKTAVLKELLPKISNKNSSNEYYLTDCISLAFGLNRSVGHVLVNDSDFLGVNDKFALAQAEFIMSQRIKETHLRNGVIMHLPDNIYIDARASLEGECELWPNVVIKGECEIENSVIESGAVVVQSKIKNAHIKAGSIVENSVVENSQIGPMAHLRPHSIIKHTQIGNFVELKNANLNGVKAGHLSYLGDCEIGVGSNIGCGTVTCNYDGVKKHQTKIGKNVFVGSNTAFVAPVCIADDTAIAAGSVVTQNSKKGDLVIARSKQENKENGFYKLFGSKK